MRFFLFSRRFDVDLIIRQFFFYSWSRVCALAFRKASFPCATYTHFGVDYAYRSISSKAYGVAVLRKIIQSDCRRIATARQDDFCLPHIFCKQLDGQTATHFCRRRRVDEFTSDVISCHLLEKPHGFLPWAERYKKLSHFQPPILYVSALFQYIWKALFLWFVA